MAGKEETAVPAVVAEGEVVQPAPAMRVPAAKVEMEETVVTVETAAMLPSFIVRRETLLSVIRISLFEIPADQRVLVDLLASVDKAAQAAAVQTLRALQDPPEFTGNLVQEETTGYQAKMALPR